MEKIRIGVAQVPQTADIQKNLDKTIQFMEKAFDRGVEILCFPETHLSGYRVGLREPDDPCDEDGLSRAAETISKKCRELSLGIILGTETPNPGGKPFNSALVLDRNGDQIALHHKSKLTPKDALAYSPGDGPTSFSFNGIPMGLVICFEGFRFPESTRELARGGARIVFHPQCNHFFPKMEWKLPVHESLIVTRAAENTIWFISANMSHPRNNCRSLIVNPNGLIISASVLTCEMLIMADCSPDHATHAFLKDDPEEMMRALAEISH